MQYIQWSWKAIIAAIAPIVIYLIEQNQEAINNWVVFIVGSALAGIVAWLKANGPDPR